MAGYYDKNKDYSLEIVKAQQRGDSKESIDKLRQERQNKIDSTYGGKDPYQGKNDIMGNGGSGNRGNSSSGGGGSNRNNTATQLPGNPNQRPQATQTPYTPQQAPALNQYGYRDGFDYSAAMSDPTISAAQRAQYQQERQNKISQKYGGVEPNMTGSNQKFSQKAAGSGNPYVKGPGYGTGGYTTPGAYGAPVLEPTDMSGYWKKMTGGADMSRRMDLANGYAISNGYTVFYDENGYAKKAVKGVADYTPHQDINVGNGTYGKNGAWTDREMMGDKQGSDFWKIQEIRERLNRGEITGDQANALANEIRAGYGYSIDKNGYVTDNGALSSVNDLRNRLGLSTNPEGGSTAYYRYLMGTDTSPAARSAGNVKSYQSFASENGYNAPTTPGAWGAPSTGVNGNVPTGTTVPLPGNSASDLDWSQISGGGSGGPGSINPGATDAWNPGSMNNYLDRWYQDAKKQQENTIDFGTSQGVNELYRAQQDAEAQYQAQRNQIAIDEAKAKDNQALYAEARGDKGGIGAAQYDSIMNTAAQNRLAVNSAQTKLATDTARQIADLRAQGEYEKADAMLQLSQQYLSQLMSLEQWSMEYNLSVAQFNASLQQWQKEYDLKVADLLGSYNGTPTMSAKQFAFQQQQYQDERNDAQDKKLASAGETLLAAGIMPSASQLKAMGLTQNDAQNYITALKVQMAAKSKSSGKGSGSGSSTLGEPDYTGLFQAAKAAKVSPEVFLGSKSNLKKYGVDNTNTDDLVSAYEDWLESSNRGVTRYPTPIGPVKLDAPKYMDLRTSILNLVNQGKADQAYKMYDQYFSYLTEAQKKELNGYLKAGKGGN